MSRSLSGSRIALTLRRLRGRFGIAAPRVAVRTHVPWHVRLASAAGIVAVLAMLAGWAYDAGGRIAGFDHGESRSTVNELRAANLALEEEVARLRGLVTAGESSLQIERAAQEQLSARNNTLALENAKLKEDLAVFERLSTLEGRLGEEVSLDRLSIRADSVKGRYHFSFLISLQGARRGKETMLDMQMVAEPRPGNTDAKIVLPESGDAEAAQYRITLRNFRRIEGVFSLPEGYPLGSVEVKIFERGLLKASKSASV